MGSICDTQLDSSINPNLSPTVAHKADEAEAENQRRQAEFELLFGDSYYIDSVQGERIAAAEEVPALTTKAKQTYDMLLPFKYDFQLPNAVTSGPILLTDGSVYTGQWWHSRRVGQGVCYTQAGSLLEGYWNCGLHYRGRVVYPSGDYYEGEFRHMCRQGQGQFIGADSGESYSGQWENDQKSGCGEEIRADGSVYTGMFRKGLKWGRGVMRWNDGCYYEGEFQEGMKHGEGTFVWGKEKYYRGSWVKDCMDGYGDLRDGENLYVGDFRQDEKHGKGLLKWGGNEYEGDFEHNEMHGRGWLSAPGKPKRFFLFQHNRREQQLDPPL